MTKAIDVDALPPTQYLVMEVLAARHRLGEPFWTFPGRLRPSLRALEGAGLVWFQSAPTPGWLRVWLTGAGRTAVLDDAYQPPAAAADFFVVMQVDRPGAEPDEDQHICLLPSAERAREIGDDLYDHYRVYALTEVEEVSGDDSA